MASTIRDGGDDDAGGGIHRLPIGGREYLAFATERVSAALDVLRGLSEHQEVPIEMKRAIQDLAMAEIALVKAKTPTCLSNLPSVCVIVLLQYLDMLSLAEVCSSSKALYRDGTLVARCVWKHLVAANLSSPFIALPDVGGSPLGEAPKAVEVQSLRCTACGNEAELRCGTCKSVGYCSRECQVADWKQDHKLVCKQMQAFKYASRSKSFAIASHVLFLVKNSQVLIMGGMGKGGEATRKTIKMTVGGHDGTIRFEESTPLLLGRLNHGVVYHQGEVISIGYSKVERLDTLSQKRTQVEEQLPNDLRFVATIIYDNKLLAIGGKSEVVVPGGAGGFGPFVYSDTVLQLNYEHGHQASQGTWTVQNARLNTARSGAAVVEFEGRIFLCGGIGDDDVPLRSVEVFDPAIGAWQLQEDEMTKARELASLFVYMGELYLVSGDLKGLLSGSRPTTIEKRNKDTLQWELVPGCGKDRWGCAVMLVDSKIFLIGGGQHTTTFDYMDLRTQIWASQDRKGAFFDEASRRLPCEVQGSKAVLVSPTAAKIKDWILLDVVA